MTSTSIRAIPSPSRPPENPSLLTEEQLGLLRATKAEICISDLNFTRPRAKAILQNGPMSDSLGDVNKIMEKAQSNKRTFLYYKDFIIDCMLECCCLLSESEVKNMIVGGGSSKQFNEDLFTDAFNSVLAILNVKNS